MCTLSSLCLQGSTKCPGAPVDADALHRHKHKHKPGRAPPSAASTRRLANMANRDKPAIVW